MKTLLAFGTAVLMSVGGWVAVAAADPLPVVPASSPVIHLPDAPPSPPKPLNPTRLAANSVFVISSTVPCVVTTSPLGLVKVTSEIASPPGAAQVVKVKGYFVDGLPGKAECRRHTEPYLYFLDAAGVGQAELLVVPQGMASEADIIRRQLDVDNTSPSPGPAPPGPTPVPPGPTPPAPGPIDPLTVALQAAYALDTDADRAASLAALVTLYKTTLPGDLTSLSLSTLGDLFAQVALERSKIVTATKVVNLRKAIGAQLNKDLPGDGSTPIDKAAVAASFAKITAALGGVR